MKNKEYRIQINAPKQRVWDIMLGEQSYTEWTKGFSENSQVVGEWKQGATIDFIDPGMGGTRAKLDIVNEPNRILANHIAILSKDGEIDTKSEAAKTWVGTSEDYSLNEKNGVTTLTILMHYHPNFEKMLDDGWKKSLKLLKALCEA